MYVCGLKCVSLQVMHIRMYYVHTFMVSSTSMYVIHVSLVNVWTGDCTLNSIMYEQILLYHNYYNFCCSLRKLQGDEEVDFQVKLSKLMNGIGCGLIASWNRFVLEYPSGN